MRRPAVVSPFAFTMVWTLASLAMLPTGALAQVLEGELPSDRYGAAAAFAGDVNGDGYDDFVVGAPDNDQNGDAAGAAYLYLGRYGAWPAQPSLVLRGQTGGDQFGYAVAAAGDINDDGYDDFLVGAPGRDSGGSESGRVYLYLGGGGTPDGTADAWWDGDWPGARFGAAVAGGFDFNGDHRSDFAVGAPDHSQSAFRSGQVSLYLGGTPLPTAPAFTFSGDQANWALGFAIDTAGDVNTDGFDDLIAGAPQPYDLNTGRAVIWYGRSSVIGTPARLVLSGETGADRFGWDVSGAGDLNGDNRDDVLVGAPRHALDNGAAYAFFGGTNMDSQYDWRVVGADGGDELGTSVDGGFDLTGDSRTDIAVGAPGTDTPATRAGRVLLYYGRATLSTTADRLVSPVSPIPAFVAEDRFGAVVRFVGSYNGDAWAELVAGAPDGNGASGSAVGYVNLVTHADTFVPVTLASLTALADAGGAGIRWALADAQGLAGLRVEALDGASMPRAVHAGWLPPDTRTVHDGMGAEGTVYRLYALDRGSVETLLGSAVAAPAIPRPALSARRNPFRGTVELLLAAPGEGAVEVTVRDAAGRLVRTLRSPENPGDGTRTLAWSGEDERGRTVPPGLYFVTAAGRGATASLKLIRLP